MVYYPLLLVLQFDRFLAFSLDLESAELAMHFRGRLLNGCSRKRRSVNLVLYIGKSHPQKSVPDILSFFNLFSGNDLFFYLFKLAGKVTECRTQLNQLLAD